ASSRRRSTGRRRSRPTRRWRPRPSRRRSPDGSSGCAPCSPRRGGSRPYVQNSRRMTGHVRALLAEVAGTFLFFFVGAGAIIATGGDNLVAIALAHGLGLSVAVSAFGGVSGGHFNPAVSFGLAIAGKHPWVRVPTYWIAQAVGALIAGFAL